MILFSKNALRFETQLDCRQIEKRLSELKESCYIKLGRRNKFVIRKKMFSLALSRVPMRVYLKGKIVIKEKRTFVTVKVASAMTIFDFLSFFIPTSFMIMIIGRKIGVDMRNVVITVVAISVYVLLLSNFLVRVTQTAKTIQADTIDILKRNLELVHIAN